MRAVRYERFGPPDVLQVVDVPEPVPRAGEIKVRVRAASLNPLDWKIRAGHVRLVPLFARPPRITGCDFAGEIVGIGGGAGPRHVGERVFGSLSPFGREGSCAEYLVIAAARVTPTPATVGDEAAATLPIAGGAALQGLADEALVGPGRRVLITGAAGGVGHFAVQVAKHLGAYTVATCSAANVEFARTLGADEVVDYALPDASSQIGDGYDVVFDVAESIGWNRARRLLVRNGLYLGTGGSTATAVQTSIASVVAPLLAGMRARTLVLKGGSAMNERLAALVAAGALTPHVARRVPLDEVADAQQAMQTGHGRGKIVVIPGSAPAAG